MWHSRSHISAGKNSLLSHTHDQITAVFVCKCVCVSKQAGHRADGRSGAGLSGKSTLVSQPRLLCVYRRYDPHRNRKCLHSDQQLWGGEHVEESPLSPRLNHSCLTLFKGFRWFSPNWTFKLKKGKFPQKWFSFVLFCFFTSFRLVDVFLEFFLLCRRDGVVS